MITSPYEKYKQSSVQTSNPAKLLIMLYDGAIRFIKGGIEVIDGKDYEKTNDFFKKAQAIVTELNATLDFSYEISEKLAALYEYINHLLFEANVKKISAPAEEAIVHLSELREAWVQASRLSSQVQENANG